MKLVNILYGIKGVIRMKQASVHDFPNVEECKLFEGIKCDKCMACESEMEKWLISKGVRRMTDKRFKFICDDEKCFFKDGNKALYCYEVIDLLNSLYEENEQLKQSNNDAWNLIQYIYNEIKEDGYMDWGRIQDLVEFEYD